MNGYGNNSFQSILSVLPEPFCSILDSLVPAVKKGIREIRLRSGQPVYLQTEDGGRFLSASGQIILHLELGVGGNTPVIIKYPFWKMTAQNKNAVYACINIGEAIAPDEINNRSICIDGDIEATIRDILKH